MKLFKFLLGILFVFFALLIFSVDAEAKQTIKADFQTELNADFDFNGFDFEPVFNPPLHNGRMYLREIKQDYRAISDRHTLLAKLRIKHSHEMNLHRLNSYLCSTKVLY